jgi:tRNA nucleotidyltransferase (CCA-adding enzyme)
MGNIKNDAITALRIFEKNGYEAYIVGGAVRDIILGLPLEEINDFDISTNAKPFQVGKFFTSKPTGEKFGGVTIHFRDTEFQVTTYRIDGEYEDSRHPDVVYFNATLEEDVARRDFTINGLLMNSKGEILDLCEGRKDLDNKIIRCIGDPISRFKEDLLRILRMFYFQSKLDFEIEENTLLAASILKDSLIKLPNERVLIEILKILKGKNSLKAIKSMYSSEVYLGLPGLEKGIEFFSKSDMIPYIDTFFALSFYLNGNIPEWWKLDNMSKNLYTKVIELGKNTNNYCNTILYQYGLNICLLTNRVLYFLGKEKNRKNEIENNFNNLPIGAEVQLALTSKEMIEMVNKPIGAWLGKLRKELVIMILENKIQNVKSDIIQVIKEKIKSGIK